MNEPIIRPRMSVARFSFLRATRRFSRSGSLGFGGSAYWGSFAKSGTSRLTATTPTFAPAFLSCLPSLPAAWLLPRPKMPGFIRRSLSGFLTETRLTPPESDDDGSNSLTMSFSMATLIVLARISIASDCRTSPFIDVFESLSIKSSVSKFYVKSRTCVWTRKWQKYSKSILKCNCDV